jgi:hypothetical protein
MEKNIPFFKVFGRNIGDFRLRDNAKVSIFTLWLTFFITNKGYFMEQSRMGKG